MRGTSIALAILLSFGAAPLAAQTSQPAKLEVRHSAEQGSHLTVGGRPVYLFTADRRGQGSAVAESRCDAKCLEIWPPVTTMGDPEAGSQVQDTKIDTIPQAGSHHVTYDGWPLYYFAKDAAPGTATGHGKSGFGGEWLLVTPDGQPVQAGGAAAPSPTGGAAGESSHRP